MSPLRRRGGHRSGGARTGVSERGSAVLSADPETLGNEPPPLAHQLGELAGGKVVGALVELVGLWTLGEGAGFDRGPVSIRQVAGSPEWVL